MQARHCRMVHERWLYAVCIYKRCHLPSRWIIVSPFPTCFLNRDASFFDLCLYALWPWQFQSRDNSSSPVKTVRHASLCLLGVWIIAFPHPPRFLKRDPSSFDIRLYTCSQRIYARVVVELELRYVGAAPVIIASVDAI